MAEKWTLDPDGIALPLHESAGPIHWDKQDITFSPGERKSVRIEPTSEDGEVVTHGARANATISGTLWVREGGGTEHAQALADLQAAEEAVARDGLVLEREFHDASTIRYDVLRLDIDWVFFHRTANQLPVTFEVFRGLGYGSEVAVDPVTVNDGSQPHVTGTLTVAGAAKARARFTIEDLQSEDHLWALACARPFDGDATAKLYYLAEDLTPGANAGTAAFSNSYGTNIVQHDALSQHSWDVVVSSEIDGVGHMTHTGSYRVWARIAQTDELVASEWMFGWRQGSGPLTLNDPQFISQLGHTLGGAHFQLLDLGFVNLRPGFPRWMWRLFARSPLASSPRSGGVDYVFFAPAGHYAEVGGDIIGSDTVEAAHVVRDDFGFSGNLHDRTPDIGSSNWVTGGATTDFTGSGSDTETIQRSTTSDSNARWAEVGAAMTTSAARVDVRASNFDTGDFGVRMGLRLRADNGVAGSVSAILEKNRFELWHGTSPPAASRVSFTPQPNTWYTLFVVVLGNQAMARVLHRGAVVAEVRRWSPLFNPSGRVGLRDRNVDTGASTRLYRRFAAWVPDVDPAIPNDGALEVAFDEAKRIDSGDATPKVASSGFWLPNSGRENHTIEWAVLTSQGNPRLEMADPTGVNKRVTPRYTPQYPVIPEDPTGPGS